MLRKSTAHTKNGNGSEDFADRLKRLRIQNNLSQTEIAAKVGLTKLNISRYETRSSRPKADALKKLADALNVSSDYLLEGTETGALRTNLEDKRVLEVFRELEKLPPNDKDYIVTLVEDLITTKKIKQLAAQG